MRGGSESGIGISYSAGRCLKGRGSMAEGVDLAKRGITDIYEYEGLSWFFSGTSS